MAELGHHHKGRTASKGSHLEDNRQKSSRQLPQEPKLNARSQSPVKNGQHSATTRVRGLELLESIRESTTEGKKSALLPNPDKNHIQIYKELRLNTAESDSHEYTAKKVPETQTKGVNISSGIKQGNSQQKEAKTRVQVDSGEEPAERHRDLAKYIQSMQKRMLGDSQRHAEKITDLQNKRIKQLGTKKVNLKSSASNFSDLKHMTSSGTNLLANLAPKPDNNSVTEEAEHSDAMHYEITQHNAHLGKPLGMVSPSNKKSFQVFGDKASQKPRVVLDSLEAKSQDDSNYMLKPVAGSAQTQVNQKTSRVIGNANQQPVQPMTPKYESTLVGLSERGKKSRRSPTLAESFNLATTRKTDYIEVHPPRKPIGFESPVMGSKNRPVIGNPVALATPVSVSNPQPPAAQVLLAPSVQLCKSPPSKKDPLKSMIKKETEINNMHKIDAFLGRDKAIQSGKNDLKEKLKKFRNEFNKLDEPDNQPEEGMEHLDMKQVIGTGTYALVHLARDKHTGDDVAVKLYDRIKLLDPIKQRNFECEVANLRSLSHQNIIKLLDVIEGKKKVVLVMEYIGSHSMYDVLAARPKNKLTEQGRFEVT